MNPSPDSTPTPEEISQANQTVSQTPATLPLKRPAPIFVEAELPAVTPAPIAATPDPTAVTPAPTAAPAPPPAPKAPPQAANSLPAVEFSPPPGAPVQSSLTLELRSAEGAEIRYALNASDVGADGLVYDSKQKIFLTQNTSVAARTFVGGQLGPLATGDFQIIRPAWQKIEPLDQSDPTPHEIGEQCVLEGPWRLAAASTRGKLHAHRGLWREDSLSYGLAHAVDGTYAITIVSDGAGSANLSRVGSKLLCAVALEHLQSGLTAFAPLAADDKTLVARDLPPLRALLVEAASLALRELREEAARRSKSLGDFSSTLLILVRREWNGAQLCAALQAGDGSIALWDDDGDLTFLGEADHGAHTSETKFLTTSGMEAELPARVKFSIRPRLRAALVMSDGIADDFFPEPVRFPELVGQTLPLVERDAAGSGATLLEWMRYEKKGSSDDRALIISWREAPSVAAEPVAAELAAVATLDAVTGAAPIASSAVTPEASSVAKTETSSPAPNAPFASPNTPSASPDIPPAAPNASSPAPSVASTLPTGVIITPATAIEPMEVVNQPAKEQNHPTEEQKHLAEEQKQLAEELRQPAEEQKQLAEKASQAAGAAVDSPVVGARAVEARGEVSEAAKVGGESASAAHGAEEMRDGQQ